MSEIHDLKRWLSMLRRAAEADPVADDVLTYQGNNQVQWRAVGAWIDHGSLGGLGDDDHVHYLISRNTRCRVYHNANQNINHGAWTALTFNSTRFDPENMHDAVGTPTIITIPATGTYLVGGTARFAAHVQDQGQRYLGISVNGVPGTLIALHQVHTSAGVARVMGIAISTLWEFTAADAVRLVVWQDSGGVLAVNTLNAYSPEFWIQRFA